MTHLFLSTQVVAILCLSLAASYHFSGSIACPGSPQNHTLTVETTYPLYSWTLHNVTLSKIIDSPTNIPLTPIDIDMKGDYANTLIGQGAQLYVTWSVATMLYCIAATFVYMFVTANEGLEKVMDLLVYAVSLFLVMCCSYYIPVVYLWLYGVYVIFSV